MKIQLPNQQQLGALGRDAMKVGGTAVTVLAAFSVLTPDQAAIVTTSLKHIGHDLSDLWVSGGAIVTIGSIAWTQFKNTHAGIAQAAAELPGTTVVTTPAIAASSPQTNVLSTSDVKVTAKGA